ncbi:uncharacterized protein Z519_10859 [Cladophialophora bantiana CBS 173.52]|uniref:Uncharacterized protein n=1 Tax=Cladophialophora bantiana (strain ATCC 10958 / CBS 173.52 / CDC B-1940 / NIH 8579) TaxID=1442370 RepID=A0A0D2FNM2_CLAB1|nr:uncharacterized protein Z519_10859 [Cladophialophora bantiana CBS 173.52]KIW88292.1 hypothetical protein Z519_10859 [Cladophialophora bantiana CBS 173.52]
MALLPTEPPWNRALELCGHVVGARSPRQSSVHASIHDAGCSPSSENGNSTADGGSAPELLATTLKDEKYIVDTLKLERDLAMTAGASYDAHIPWDREAVPLPDAYNPLDLAPALIKEDSINHNTPWVHLDQVDNHVHFITKVQMIRRQRLKVQALRIRARDKRNWMKHTRNRLHKVFRDFLKANEAFHRQTHHDNTTTSFQEMGLTFQELEAQDIDLDVVESNLAPAEWELKESEKRLYEDLLGPSASDEDDSEVGIQMTEATPSWFHKRPNEKNVKVSLLPPYEATTQDRLSAMSCHRQEVKDRLVSLTKEYAALQEDVQMRAAGGLTVDVLSQEALKELPERRAQLLRELADLTVGFNTLNDMVTEGPDLMSREADILFGHDQFDDLQPDVMTQQSLTEDDEVLHLQAHHQEERNGDILPFLTQPLVVTLSHPQVLEEQPCVPPLTQYSSIAWDLRGRDAETLSGSVSMWILGCVQSSWWSLIRFVFMSDLNERFSTKTVADYVRATWLESNINYIPLTDFSEDPEYSGFSFTLEDEIFTPLSDATDSQELQWQNRPLKRRRPRSSELSDHAYPKAG